VAVPYHTGTTGVLEFAREPFYETEIGWVLVSWLSDRRGTVGCTQYEPSGRVYGGEHGRWYHPVDGEL